LIRIKFGFTHAHMRGRQAKGEGCAECAVRDAALCRVLDADSLAALSARAVRRTLARGDTLFHQGDDMLCGNLISGTLKMVARDADGREQVVALMFPGDFVGRISGRERHETVALGRAELCLFPRASMAGQIAESPAMSLLLMERTQQSVDEARERLSLLLRGRADERVAALLRDFAARAGAPAFDLPMTRADMADVLALTPETVSRALARMSALGFVETEGRRRIRLRAGDRLRA